MCRYEANAYAVKVILEESQLNSSYHLTPFHCSFELLNLQFRVYVYLKDEERGVRLISEVYLNRKPATRVWFGNQGSHKDCYLPSMLLSVGEGSLRNTTLPFMKSFQNPRPRCKSFEKQAGWACLWGAEGNSGYLWKSWCRKGTLSSRTWKQSTWWSVFSYNVNDELIKELKNITYLSTNEILPVFCLCSGKQIGKAFS